MRGWLWFALLFILSGVFAGLGPRIVGDSTLALVLTLIGAVIVVAVLAIRQWRIDQRRRREDS